MRKMSLSEMITYSTVKLVCEYNDGSSGRGTGFIVNLCRDAEENKVIPVIITNNHVVNNCKKTMFQFCQANAANEPVDNKPFSVEWGGDNWIHHPNTAVDLCCLPLGIVINKIREAGHNIFYIPLETDLIADSAFLSELRAIEDVVMIGYPSGISDEYNHKPIIRKGITATHPKNDYQGKKEILLDIAAYPGSSGSPVFILNEGTYVTGNTVQIGSRIKLIGVLYGGPQFTATGVIAFSTLPVKPIPVTNIPMNLGIVIKAEQIMEFEKILKQ